MFTTKENLKKMIKEVLTGGDEQTIKSLKVELEDLKTRKIMEEREIKHLVKLKEEKLDIEFKGKNLDLKSEFKDKEMELQTKYHDKVMGQIDDARKEMKEVYTAIMERLPNVNVEMKK